MVRFGRTIRFADAGSQYLGMWEWGDLKQKERETGRGRGGRERERERERGTTYFNINDNKISALLLHHENKRSFQFAC